MRWIPPLYLHHNLQTTTPWSFLLPWLPWLPLGVSSLESAASPASLKVVDPAPLSDLFRLHHLKQRFGDCFWLSAVRYVFFNMFRVYVATVFPAHVWSASYKGVSSCLCSLKPILLIQQMPDNVSPFNMVRSLDRRRGPLRKPLYAGSP